MLLNYGLYPTKFGRAKPKILSQRDRTKPELCGFLVPVGVHMRRLIGFVTVEIEAIRTRSEHSWHNDII